MKKLIALLVLLMSGAPLLAAEDAPTPSFAAAPAAGVPWSSLDSEQRQLLSQFESRWGELPPRAPVRTVARCCALGAHEPRRKIAGHRPFRSLAQSQ